MGLLAGRTLSTFCLLGSLYARRFPELYGQTTEDARRPAEAPAQALVPGEEESAAESPAPGSALDPSGNLSGRGLLEIRDPFPLAVLHLQLPINTLERIEESQGKFEVNFSWANTFVLNDTLLVDAETYRLELSGWYALRNDFYIGAGIPILARGGGILDPLVKGFHGAFNLTSGGRESRPTNGYEITIQDGGDRRSLDSGTGLGDFALKSHWNVNPGDAWLPAVSLDGILSLPTSMAGFGSSGLDLGISLSLYKKVLRSCHLYAVLGLTYLTDPKTQGLTYQKVGNQGVAGIEFSLTRSFSLFFQAMSFSPLLEHPPLLNKVRNYVAAGFKWEFADGCELELSLLENLSPFTNSADIAFNAGFAFHF